MKKIVAGRSAIRLQDTPKGKNPGTVNEDAFGMTNNSIIVADGMGGGGKTVARENLENLLTKNISDDARYIAENMLVRADQISVSNMVAWGLVDYIAHGKPNSIEETRGYVDRVRSAVREIVPSGMKLDNVGSTLTYIDDDRNIVLGAGDSLAFTVYKDGAQFHNLNGFDSISMKVLQKNQGFNPYNPLDWDTLRDHPHSNIVTNVVLLGDEHEYEIHAEQLNIDQTKKSITFAMSDGIAPDFVNPVEVYNIAQQIFDGEVTQERLDLLLQQIIQKAHDNTRGMWEYDPSRKTDDATIVAMYREPSIQELIDDLYNDGATDVTGESVDGYLGGTVQTPNCPKDTRDLGEEITDPKITTVMVEEYSEFEQWEQDWLKSDVSKQAVADAIVRSEKLHAERLRKQAEKEEKWRESIWYRTMTAYTGMFDKIEEWVDDKLVRIGDKIGEWHRVREETDYTEFLEDEGKIVVETVTDSETQMYKTETVQDNLGLENTVEESNLTAEYTFPSDLSEDESSEEYVPLRVHVTGAVDHLSNAANILDEIDNILDDFGSDEISQTPLLVSEDLESENELFSEPQTYVSENDVIMSENELSSEAQVYDNDPVAAIESDFLSESQSYISEDGSERENESISEPQVYVSESSEDQYSQPINPSQENVSSSADSDNRPAQPGLLESIIGTVSSAYDSSRVYVGETLNDWKTGYNTWSSERAENKEKLRQEKEKLRQEKVEAKKEAYEKAAQKAQEKSEQIAREREMYRHMDSHRTRARSQYWANQRDLMSQRVGYMTDRLTSRTTRNLAAGLLVAGAMSTAGIVAYENRDKILGYMENAQEQGSSPAEVFEQRVQTAIDDNKCSELKIVYQDLKKGEGTFDMLRDVRKSLKGCENE